MPAMHNIRLMTQADIPAALALQAECYGIGMNESEAVFRSRLDAAPDSAWLATDAQGALAYLVGYRSRLGKLTLLGDTFTPAAMPDCLYLHDLAVSPRAQGSGLARGLLLHAWSLAQREGLAYSALVSVQDSQRFWRKLGYEVWESLTADELAKLSSYTGPSYYMVRQLIT
ncbi:GNAT family N-acetyltransferase [Uliginosibacterium sp. H3]|uniref:GNAT family N-acetyltransferase n=1 Tax=Uliginosibacterium silvisoli TaxID=3114758 RepID=A0ABU6JYV0_9RHOO|nr:GNAT family N-acetyltransferase [Uliginosibacterium sp. H3]